MKSLASSSLSNIFVNTKIDSGFCSCGQFLPTRHQVVFFPSNKPRFLHFICVQRNPLPHISSCSSYLSPESQTDLELAENSNQDKYQSETVRVKFQLKKECSFGEQFAIVGDDPILGMWEPDNAIPLNWSDDHVWNLELDIPIGISVQFKFVLKEITGKILWQPGPDRILETWKTKNVIVVWEDWEDATSQKLLEEEESISNQNVDTAVTKEMRFVAENLIHHNEELVSDVKKETVIADVKSYPAKEPLPPTDEKPIMVDNTVSSDEKYIVIVADNIIISKEEPAASAGHQGFKEEHEANSNKNTITEEEILQNNVRTPTLVDSASTDVEGNLVIHQGDPVLVPGLPYSEPEIHDAGEKSSALDASFGVNEEENHNLPERPNNIQLDEKLEIDVDPHPAEMTEVSSDVEQLENELQQKPEVINENQYESIPVRKNVVQNDVQWGRKTIQKLLTNLGFIH